MTVHKDTNGTYFVSLYLKDPNPGKRYKHITKRGFKKKSDALAYEKEHANDVVPRESDDTFYDICKRWEANSQASMGSVRQHKEHFTIRFPDLMHKKITDISKSDLLEWRAWLSLQPFATKTKNTTITYVKGVFKYASDTYDIPDPSKAITRFKKTDLELMEEFEVWTPEEFCRFLESVDEALYSLYFEFLYWTGCRRGEGIALQVKDLNHGYADIKYSQRDATTGLRPTKTRQRRRIQIDARLYAKLKAYTDIQGGPYVFGGEKPLSPTVISRRFNQAIEKSGVKRIRLHDLRHSHATWLINNGVNIVAVSKRLGHSDINETLKTYTHLLESTDQRMMDKINEFKSISWDTKSQTKVEIDTN